MLSLTGVCALFTVCVLFFILGYLVWYGGKSLNWAFFTHFRPLWAKRAGEWPTPLWAAASCCCWLPCRRPDWLPGGRLPGGIRRPDLFFRGALHHRSVERRALDRDGNFRLHDHGLPMKHFSTLAGGLALGVMMIPIAVRSTEEALRAVPPMLREGALALGASKWKTVATVVVPAAVRGIMTGIMLTWRAWPGRPRPCSSPPSAIASGARGGINPSPPCRS